MKKIIVIVLLIIIIPYLIVSTIKDKEEYIKFNYVSNLAVKVKRETTGQIDRVLFEEYVRGVLAGEMPVSFEKEALKAQAVAARSYVLKKMEQARAKNQDYDVVDTVSNQVYLDDAYLKEKWKNKYQENISKLNEVIVETRGQYLTYDEEIVQAFFFSTSTGVTENSGEIFTTQLPYLKSVDSSWDAEVSPVFNESNEMSLIDFYTKLDIEYQPELKIEVTKKTSTGRIKNIKINEHEFTGNQVYQALGIRSNYFEIKQVGDNVAVTTKGYGHGVGMSQYGALAMAKKGYKYDEILKYYYQGVEISKL